MSDSHSNDAVADDAAWSHGMYLCYLSLKKKRRVGGQVIKVTMSKRGGRPGNQGDHVEKRVGGGPGDECGEMQETEIILEIE